MLGSGNPIETTSRRSVTNCRRRLPPSQHRSLGIHWIVRRASTMHGLSHSKYWSLLKASVTSSARPELHELTYVGVRRYRIDAPAGQRGQGDLIVHEVRIEEDDLIVHELLFANGGTVEVGCADFFYTERLLGTGASGLTSA